MGAALFFALTEALPLFNTIAFSLGLLLTLAAIAPADAPASDAEPEGPVLCVLIWIPVKFPESVLGSPRSICCVESPAFAALFAVCLRAITCEDGRAPADSIFVAVPAVLGGVPVVASGFPLPPKSLVEIPLSVIELALPVAFVTSTVEGALTTGELLFG
jgi:hypothetical protein